MRIVSFVLWITVYILIVLAVVASEYISSYAESIIYIGTVIVSSLFGAASCYLAMIKVNRG